MNAQAKLQSDTQWQVEFKYKYKLYRSIYLFTWGIILAAALCVLIMKVMEFTYLIMMVLALACLMGLEVYLSRFSKWLICPKCEKRWIEFPWLGIEYIFYESGSSCLYCNFSLSGEEHLPYAQQNILPQPARCKMHPEEWVQWGCLRCSGKWCELCNTEFLNRQSYCHEFKNIDRVVTVSPELVAYLVSRKSRQSYRSIYVVLVIAAVTFLIDFGIKKLGY